MQRVIKSTLGYKTVENAETHIILTVEEYNSFIDERDKLKLNNQLQIREIEELKNQFSVNVKRESYEKEKIINNLQMQIEKLENEVKNLENLNKNLIRICRERANSERKIKKKSAGYKCSSIESYKFNAVNKDFIKIIFETPYTYNFKFENVKILILKDFKDTILNKFKCDELIDYHNFINLYSYNDNKKYIVYKNLKAYNNKFWTIDIYIDTSIEIPEDFL